MVACHWSGDSIAQGKLNRLAVINWSMGILYRTATEVNESLGSTTCNQQQEYLLLDVDP
jgi:hypothetical protein